MDKVKATVNEKLDFDIDSFKSQGGLQAYFENAYAFIIFPKVAKGGFGFGGAFGNGNVYLNNKDGTETQVGTSQLLEVSFGFQVGGQVSSHVIFIETQMDFERFSKAGSFEGVADANAVALTASASASASTMGNQGPTAGKSPDDQKIGRADVVYSKGFASFNVALGGLMYQATFAGQKFTYMPIQSDATATE